MITSNQVKALREKTGAGMMDCKKALEAAGGDVEKAIQILRERGAAVAAKRIDKATHQGLVEAYIHTGGRIGALVEVNCETDFVAKTEDFRTLAKNIAMQVAAMNPLVISRDQLDKVIVEKELGVYRAQAKNEGKSNEVAEKIAQERLEKFFQEFCLLDQTFIKDSGKTIRDLIYEMTAKVGEKVTIRRFERFHLGDDQK